MTKTSQTVTTSNLAKLPSLREIRSEIISGNRESAEASSFNQGLVQIQKALYRVPPEPKKEGWISSATEESKLHRAILWEGDLSQDKCDVVDSWASKSIIGTGKFRELFSYLLGYCGVVSGILGTVGLAYEFLGEQSGIGGMASALAIGMGLLLFGSGIALNRYQLDMTIRNRVIRRKAYKRELCRLQEEGQRVRERNAKLRKMRETYLNEAKKALTPYRDDFEIANPGQTLAIVESAETYKIQAVKDESYSELARISAMTLKAEPAMTSMQKAKE